ncbi:hypothetical protein AVEN_113838-1 [Araneus ventricosus]|uniref:Uncharacterized protein n=1 Tax=Araneus ventricosus TaxID=182803 RepID=A0A4Y2JDD5_ARAVE|nr:hypothetical protein AVEN_113838-1 [Araneus ventricosus]
MSTQHCDAAPIMWNILRFSKATNHLRTACATVLGELKLCSFIIICHLVHLRKSRLDFMLVEMNVLTLTVKISSNGPRLDAVVASQIGTSESTLLTTFGSPPINILSHHVVLL